MRDDAVSNSAAVLMMLATVLGVSAAVFLHVIYGADDGPPTGIELSSWAAMPDPLTKEFAITNVTGAYNWSMVTVEVDGRALHYDGNGKAAAGFCVALSAGRGCMDGAEWLPNRIPVKLDQHVTVHAGDLRGKDVRVLVNGQERWAGKIS